MPAPHPFVPLAAAPGTPGENTTFRVKVLTDAAPRPAFEPLPTPEPASVPSQVCGQPTITAHRNGDTISSIRIQCSCGQIIELECRY